MSLETDSRTSAQSAQEEAKPGAVEQSAELPPAGSVNRRGLIKAVGGGILGALAVQEVLAPAALASTSRQPAAEPAPARSSAPAPTAGVAGMFDV